MTGSVRRLARDGRAGSARLLLAALLAVGLGASARPAGSAEARLGAVSIVAPTPPGTGLDQLARALGSGLSTSGLVSDVEVINVPGAGGVAALERFVSPSPGEVAGATKLMVMSLSGLIKAVQVGRSDALAQMVPVARLTAEPLALVVPAESELRTAGDLARALKGDPIGVVWAGGSAGGVDHVTAGLFARAVGVDPQQLNYVPFVNGTEALSALLRAQAKVGIGMIAEFEGQIAAGRLRLIATTGSERAAGTEAPTLKEQGIDLAVTDWRGLVAAPTGVDDRSRLGKALQSLTRSEAWAERMRARRWRQAYLDGEGFADLVKGEQARVDNLLGALGLATTLQPAR